MLYRTGPALLRCLRRERVLVIIYDDFSTDTADSYRKTLDFLGVASGCVGVAFEVINGNVNGNLSVRSRALRATLNDPLVRRLAIGLRRWVPRRIFTAVQKTGLRLEAINSIKSPEKRSPPESELQLSLRREFAPEVERLSALLERDLTHWSRTGSGNFETGSGPDENRKAQSVLNQVWFETT